MSNLLDAINEVETREKNKLTFNVNGVYTAMNADSISETADFFIKNLKVPYTICLVRGEDIQNNDYKKVDVDHYYKTYKKIMKDNDYELDTQNQIWITK